ncbi:PAS domain S-box-containing protein [Cohaesibacter sp. ES.047]|uniref:PAS domain-containing protein n=1 Tax=Cohaesibacter sp. ES.047 TaxID=1798205 RepID=UPI000BB76DF0|nr:PAS domain S-box protein [Cohaesibacter sp. ES.047]SNY92600.1 PAS domain S-box-containing protein [Cohaesibacter sp. ES.047]
MGQSVYVSGVERYFDADDIIVSKTDLKGRLTYANRLFLDLSGYTEKEVLGQPHSMIRHPEMPRCIFKVLWGAIETGNEIFAYVNNRSKNGDNYWVYAHVTPSLSVDGKVVGYHSNRRVPDRKILESHVFPLYAKLKSIEDKHTNRKDGLLASEKAMNEILVEKGVDYTEFIVTLGQRRRRGFR